MERPNAAFPSSSLAICLQNIRSPFLNLLREKCKVLELSACKLEDQLRGLELLTGASE